MRPENPSPSLTTPSATTPSPTTPSPTTRPLRLSLFLLIDHYPRRGQTLHRRLRRHVELAESAERLGYEGVFVAEHHFSDFGVAPNPAVVLAAMAARTSTLRLGPAVAVLPLRHPLQVVEDYGLVDQLSEGRLVLGVGSGSLGSEFTGFGLDVATKRQVFDQRLDAVLQAFKGDGPGGVLGFGRRMPPILVASTSLEGSRAAGRRGLGLLTLASPETSGLEQVVERLDVHASEHAAGQRPEHGPEQQPEQIVTVMAHFADSADRARAEAAPALERFLRAHGAEEDDGFAVYDQMVARGTGAFGKPEVVSRRLRPLFASGVRHLSLWMGFGDMEARQLESSMRLARRLCCGERLVVRADRHQSVVAAGSVT